MPIGPKLRRAPTDGNTLCAIYGPSWRLLIVGAGQLSQYVANMAVAGDYQVVVIAPARAGAGVEHARRELLVGDARKHFPRGSEIGCRFDQQSQRATAGQAEARSLFFNAHRPRACVQHQVGQHAAADLKLICTGRPSCCRRRRRGLICTDTLIGGESTR
jgi:hypothetical protein